jgi:hypothetical protein
VHVAKRVAAQLADTDPVLHLFSLSRQKRWGSVDFATRCLVRPDWLFGGHCRCGLRVIR